MKSIKSILIILNLLIILLTSCVTQDETVQDPPDNPEDTTTVAVVPDQPAGNGLIHRFPTDSGETEPIDMEEFLLHSHSGDNRRISSMTIEDGNGEISQTAVFSYENGRLVRIETDNEGQAMTDRFTYFPAGNLYKYEREGRRYYNSKTMLYDEEKKQHQFENVSGLGLPDTLYFDYDPAKTLEIYEEIFPSASFPELLGRRFQYHFKQSRIYLSMNFFLLEEDVLFPITTIQEIRNSTSDNILKISYGFREQGSEYYTVYVAYGNDGRFRLSESYRNDKLMTTCRFTYSGNELESAEVSDPEGNLLSVVKLTWEDGTTNAGGLWY